MKKVKDAVQVKIEYFTGQEAGLEYDKSYYVASCDDLMFTTDGETFEELLGNIRECLILCLHDTDSITEFGVAPDAHIRLTMELPENYAQTA